MLRSAECGLDNYSETELDVVLLEPKADFYGAIQFICQHKKVLERH